MKLYVRCFSENVVEQIIVRPAQCCSELVPVQCSITPQLLHLSSVPGSNASPPVPPSSPQPTNDLSRVYRLKKQKTPLLSQKPCTSVYPIPPRAGQGPPARQASGDGSDKQGRAADPPTPPRPAVARRRGGSAAPSISAPRRWGR